MKIQYMSDLHLEYDENIQYFKDNPIEPLGDVLVLAGDIICDAYRDKAIYFFKDVESKFKFIISTMGNHEFYFGEISYAYPSYKNYFSENHVILNNQSIIIDNVKFIVSCLWSKVDPVHQYEISKRLNDYRYIKKNNDLINVEDTNYYHSISKEFILNELEKDFDGKVVVITHHLPTYNSVIPKWRDSNLISAFANELDDLLLNGKIDSWIFGHQHEYVNEIIGKTRILSNPLGYSKEESFNKFQSNKFIET